jgi:transposase
MTTTCDHQSTATAPNATVTLLLAFELGERTWKLGFSTGFGQRPRVRQVPAGAVDRVLEEIERAKRKFRLPAETAVISCYEAGRDGFWLHRWLIALGVTNHVVDSSSIEVNRRCRQPHPATGSVLQAEGRRRLPPG